MINKLSYIHNHQTHSNSAASPARGTLPTETLTGQPGNPLLWWHLCPCAHYLAIAQSQGAKHHPEPLKSQARMIWLGLPFAQYLNSITLLPTSVSVPFQCPKRQKKDGGAVPLSKSSPRDRPSPVPYVVPLRLIHSPIFPSPIRKEQTLEPRNITNSVHRHCGPVTADRTNWSFHLLVSGMPHAPFSRK
jgi:hypothetical protein